ncbi:MAG: Aldehyde ferredoxin oxidoreductase [Dehalococcoidia bacterium]|nr:Aldehyde ferredoxin oxidoreductase [Dehalococcoidia bacterium]
MAVSPYAGKILRVDLSTGKTVELPTAPYGESFLGGRGIAAKIYWDEVPPYVKALDPENRLIFATGPLGCYPAIGGTRWVVCGKSPALSPEHFTYSNFGGHWGAELKFAGYDALVVHGKADKPVYLFLHGSQIEIRDASALWGKGAMDAREMLKAELGQGVKVVATGPAGENGVALATILADNDASGSGGLGAVMGAKKLKAVVVKGVKKAFPVANPQRFHELLDTFRVLRGGTPISEEAMASGPQTRKDVCYGCIGNCARRVYQAKTGEKSKFMCQASRFYQARTEKYYGEKNEVPFLTTYLCNQYGIDTNALEVMVLWLWRCFQAGILTDESTGIPISKAGSLEFIETLVKKLALREGFGEVLAHGTLKAAESLGPKAQAELTDYLTLTGERGGYDPRLYITTGLFLAMEPRRPIQQLHEVALLIGRWVNWVNKKPDAYVSSDTIRAIAKKFWGSELAADYSTYDGKALGALKVQDRQYVKECLVLCDCLWPITDVESGAEDHIGDPGFESKLYSAITGQEGLNRFGERVFNLQRAILVREGRRGREDDTVMPSWFTTPLHYHPTQPQCLVPGKDGEVLCRKGEVLDKQKFEKMKDEYYALRGWDVATGLQTQAKLAELGMGDIAEDLSKRGLVK